MNCFQDIVYQTKSRKSHMSSYEKIIKNVMPKKSVTYIFFFFINENNFEQYAVEILIGSSNFFLRKKIYN